MSGVRILMRTAKYGEANRFTWNPSECKHVFLIWKRNHNGITIARNGQRAPTAGIANSKTCEFQNILHSSGTPVPRASNE
jgi:hypothetical protein